MLSIQNLWPENNVHINSTCQLTANVKSNVAIMFQTYGIDVKGQICNM